MNPTRGYNSSVATLTHHALNKHSREQKAKYIINIFFLPIFVLLSLSLWGIFSCFSSSYLSTQGPTIAADDDYYYY